MKFNYEKLLAFDLNIRNLGESKFDSPLNQVVKSTGEHKVTFISDKERILVINNQEEYDELLSKNLLIPSFEKAGPREKIYFQPGETISAVVTCGGLCPGLNSVIRALVYMNYYRYNNKIT